MAVVQPTDEGLRVAITHLGFNNCCPSHDPNWVPPKLYVYSITATLACLIYCGIMTKYTMSLNLTITKISSCIYEFVLCSSLCAAAAIGLLVSNTTLWRLYVACWAIITPQTQALDQRYEDNDLHYLIDSIHNGEWNGYNFGFMKTPNNTVLADVPTYVTHSANGPSFLVVTSLLPGRTSSQSLLKSQINTNWHKDVLLYINLD